MSRKPYSSTNQPTGKVPAAEWICYREANGEYGTDFYVKLWEPGDGLTCSHRAAPGRYIECGPPVAVTTEIQRKARHMGSATPRPWFEDNHRKFVVCADHLAIHFAGMTTGEFTTQIERSAREQVITKHWSEYQAAIDAQRGRLHADALGRLPDLIKDALGSTNGTDDE